MRTDLSRLNCLEVLRQMIDQIAVLVCGGRRKADSNSKLCGQRSEEMRTAIRSYTDTFAVSS